MDDENKDVATEATEATEETATPMADGAAPVADDATEEAAAE